MGLWLWLAAGPAPLHAQSEPPVSIRWSGPPECPGQARVLSRVRAQLADRAPTTRLQVSADLTALRNGAYRLEVSLSGAVRGERRLEVESCDAAIEAAALLVVVAIDPSRVIAPPAPGPVGTVGSSAPATTSGNPTTTGATSSGDGSEASNAAVDAGARDSAAATQKPATEPATDEPTPADADTEGDGVGAHVAGALGIGAAGDLGSLPGPTGALQLQAGVGVDAWWLFVTGAWLAPRSETIDTRASLGVGLASVSLDVCSLWGTRLQLGPCLGMEVGRMTASPSGLGDARNVTEPMLSAVGSAVGRVALTDALGAALWVSVRTAVWYPRFSADGVGEVFHPGLLGVRVGLLFSWVIG